MIASSLFAALALAGPGPQYWNKTAPKPAEKAAPVKMDEHPTGKCGGCKTSPTWAVGDRGPAGKGIGVRVAGYSHSCTGCSTGTMTTENGNNAACVDARVISKTEPRFIQANGRGPTRTVEVGKKLACTSCDIPTVVMKASGHNARGAMAPVAIKGMHDCTQNGCTPATSIARVD